MMFIDVYRVHIVIYPNYVTVSLSMIAHKRAEPCILFYLERTFLGTPIGQLLK